MDNYYQSYQLDDMYYWDLSETQKEALDICIWIVDNKCSARSCAKEFMVSHTTVLKRIQQVRRISFELYKLTRRIVCK